MTARSRSIRRVLCLGLASTFLLSACAGGALRRARQAEDLQDYDLAVARYATLAREDPNNREAQLGLERATARS